jgi:hypothetical protein
MRTFSGSLAASTLLVAALLAGCTPEAQGPACYSGIVLSNRCYDGILIQVDERYSIGSSIKSYTAPDSLGNTNVIAAVNTHTFGDLGKRGQRIYFSYENDPQQQGPNNVCNAMGAPFPIPHLVLSNLSAQPCTH